MAFGGAVVVALAVTAASGASADDVAVDSPENQLVRIAPELFSEIDQTTLVDSSGDLSSRDQRVSVALDAASHIEIEGHTTSVLLDLPFAETRGAGELSTRGQVIFDNGNNTFSAVSIKEGGSLQVASLIEGNDAPTRFEYSIRVAGSNGAALQSDGSVLYSSESGEYLAGLASPWAVDSAGASVPSHYELVGDSVVQVVNHAEGAWAYPIVADPWLGVDLISSWSYHYGCWDACGNKLSAFISAWGRAVHVSSGGAAIMDSAGWSELASKSGVAIWSLIDQ